MKGVFFLIVFGLGLVGLNGCYSLPHHYTYVQEIVYYPVPVDPPPTYYPRPPMPNPPVHHPSPPPTNPPRDRQPEKPKDTGSSYGNRDPLQGGSDRGNVEIKNNPPVRTPERKDRGQR
jgi:hypothetical protein